MKPMEVIEASRRLHAWADNYHDVIGHDFAMLADKFGVDDATRLAASVEAMREQGRLLTIGIVGRVKAGKSSLLNALLFDGRPILPKAATPMTAALTTLSFGEAFAAEVHYFTDADLERIEKESKTFGASLLLQEKETHDALVAQARGRGEAPDMARIRDVAKRQALRISTQNWPSAAASWDQWQRIQAAQPSTHESRPDQIAATSPEELASRLLDFVGPEGQYMPFTKSVDIYLPIEWLRDIRIVDTPGMDDPVRSREERTRQLLKDCDVIFIVSPAGQFLHEQDIEAMSLISSREGIRDLAVVSSQIDSQLFASEKRATPEATLDGVMQRLRDHMKRTLANLVASNPEFTGIFDDLINGDEAVLTWTSSACAGLAHRLHDTSAWDATDHTLWKNLTRAFPESFDEGNPSRALDNLRLISNVSRLRDMIDNVRHRKAQVLAERLGQWMEAKTASLRQLKEAVVEQVNRRISELEGANVEALKRERLKLQNIAKRGGSAIDEAFEAWKFDFISKMDSELHHALEEVSEKVDDKVDSAKGVEVIKARKKGLFNWVADALWDGGKEKVETVVVYRQPALAGVSLFTRTVNKRIDDTAQRNTRDARKQLEMVLASSARRYLERIYKLEADSEDYELEGETIVSWIDRAVTGVVGKLKVPPPHAVAVKRDWPSAKRLIGHEALTFLSNVKECIEELHEKVLEELDDYRQALAEKIPQHVAAVMFDELHGRIDRLINDIDNLAMSRERFDRMATELASV
jgi:hypothetical protein